jgi:hypothetical protein
MRYILVPLAHEAEPPSSIPWNAPPLATQRRCSPFAVGLAPPPASRRSRQIWIQWI